MVIWEDFIDAMSQTRLQDEYNKAITDCDIFVSLFFTKVGKYTEEEFLKAWETFKVNNKPLIYTYFKDAKINTSEIKEDDILSLFNFKKKLEDAGHYPTEYTSIDKLTNHFGDQLKKLLPELKELKSNQNRISDKEVEAKIQEALEQQLSTLDLSNSKISNIPESIGNLYSLTELYLSRNQLENLPESIGNLFRLTKLDLGFNKLTRLPESIGSLSSLTELYLSRNQLENLPESIVNLSKLTKLDLGFNQLTNLPKSIVTLFIFNLTTLDLEHNPLDVPPLQVANQGIKAIKDDFCQ